ncbi:hypothetical protein IFM60648_00048 [Aspergillus lentulus]|uniref:Uncharacterized protein n=1 Tax=Aspergillus lentulus TaxID=293939 RepID=A0ABQ0ZR03_ASPLE|nr:hypothetical protein IFM60648_00048 [Aspergillus lentulus]
MAGTNADETMCAAITRFRRKMAAANHQFLQDRINDINAKGLLTEEEKRRLLGQYRHIDHLLPQDNTALADLDIPAVLDALPAHEPADGVLLPPLLHTEQWREMYVDAVQRVCQRQADAIVLEDDDEDDDDDEEDEFEPVTIPRCDELGLFLKYAQGVMDVDFRHSGIAPFTPAWSTGVKDEELEGLDDDQRREKLADLELLKREQERLQRELEDELSNKLLEAYIDEDLDVRAGFITGVGFNQLYACPSWYSAYVYCRLCTDVAAADADAANIRDWGWRVVVFQAEVVNPSVLYGRKARFDSIPEFLDWYASWLDHLDERGLRSLRRHAVGCETDCESDCEDHATGVYAERF